MDDSLTVTSLVLAAEDGDESAWKALVDRFMPLVSVVITRFRLQGHDAEDICQTVWLRLVEHLSDLREPRALPAWIVTTTRNECLRTIKGNQRMRPFDPLDDRQAAAPVDSEEPDDRLLRNDRQQAVLAAFAELPDHQRDLLLLLIADPPVRYAEISERLGIPVGSIGPTRARALEKLRGSRPISEWHESSGQSRGRGGGWDDYATLGRG